MSLGSRRPPAYLTGMSDIPDSQASRDADPEATPPATKKPAQADEAGGPVWPEPTRYGDWERAGRVSDF